MPDFTAKKKAAIVLAEGSIQFDELHARVGESVAGLKVDRTRLVPLMAEKSIDFAVRFLASLESGQPIAIFSSDWSAEERVARENLLSGSRPDPKTALVLFTSGTGGTPKAVQLSAEGIAANTRAVIESIRLRESDSQHLFLPLSYSFGLLGHFLPAIQTGMTTTLYSDFLSIKPAFDTRSISGILSGVPSHLGTLVRMFASAEPFENVTKVVSAGSRLEPELKKKLRALFPNATLFNNYGQTEASPRILSMASDDPKFFGDVTGYPVKGITAKLIDGDELAVSGPQIMMGYLGDPEGTTLRVRDGWLHTGDRASVDEKGLVTILGRKDELVKIGGERVSPLELERVVENTGWASQVCALPVDDPLYGTRFVLFLGGVLPQTPADSALFEVLRKILSAAKVPGKIIRMDELPRNANGKFDRTKLREKLKAPR
jgi:long-chain acyl-CoA synthetase